MVKNVYNCYCNINLFGQMYSAMFCNTLSMFEPGLFLFKEYAVLLEENENLQRQFQVCFFEMSIICSCHGDVSSFLSNCVNS